jgi:hypothetical protein
MALLFVAGGVFGQDSEPRAPSNQDRSTSGVFEGPQDWYLDTDEWNKLGGSSLFFQLNTPDVGVINDFLIGGVYWLSDSMLAGLALDASSSIANTQTQSTNTILTLDSNNVIIGKAATDTRLLSDLDTLDYQVDGLVGLGVGDMDVGVGVGVDIFSSDLYGTLADVFGVLVPVLGGVTTTTLNGAVVGTVGTEYDPMGYVENSTTGFSLEGGVALPFGDAVLRASGGLGLGFVGDSEYSGARSWIQDQDNPAALPDFTPPAAALFTEETAAALPGVTDFDFDSRTRSQGYTAISGGLGATADFPFSFLGQGGMVEAGLGYSLEIDRFSNTYTDSAGAEQTIQGTVDYQYDYAYDTTIVAADEIATTITETRDWSLDGSTSSQHVIGLPAKFTAMPTPDFSWGIEFVPSFTLGTTTASSDDLTVTVTTVEDGDGINGNLDDTAANDDPDDSVTTRTQTSLGTTTETKTTQIRQQVNTGLQFFLAERFRVNAGANFDVLLMDRATTTTTVSGVDTDVTVTSTNGAAAVQTDYSIDQPGTDPSVTQIGLATTDVDYLLGFTFFFNDFLTLDARYVGSGGYQSIFEIGTFSFEATVNLP